MPSTSPYPISFQAADRLPLAPEPLSRQLRVSRAFVHLCLAAGCPLLDGQQTAAGLLCWLFENYPAVRLAAGLDPLVSIEGVEGEASLRLKMANGLLSLLEFSRSRASDPEEKRQLWGVQKRIEQILDRA